MSLLQEIVARENDVMRLDAALHGGARVEARRDIKQAIAGLEEEIRTLEAADVAATARAEELAEEQSELSLRLGHMRSAEGARDYRQATQIEHETEVLQGKLDAVEEAELELMEQSEERKSQLSDLVAQLEIKRGEYAVLLDNQARIQAELSSERDAKLAELDDLISQLPDSTVSLIQSVRSQGVSPALAMMHAGYCGNCHMALSSALRGKVISQPSVLQRCEECGVLLVAEGEGDL